MKLGVNHPMGPLKLADLVGLDICLNTMKVPHKGFRDSKCRPCPLLEKMVHGGQPGRERAAFPQPRWSQVPFQQNVREPSTNPQVLLLRLFLIGSNHADGTPNRSLQIFLLRR